jgi:hypothetical protein
MWLWGIQLIKWQAYTTVFIFIFMLPYKEMRSDTQKNINSDGSIDKTQSRVITVLHSVLNHHDFKGPCAQ